MKLINFESRHVHEKYTHKLQTWNFAKIANDDENRNEDHFKERKSSMKTIDENSTFQYFKTNPVY